LIVTFVIILTSHCLYPEFVRCNPGRGMGVCVYLCCFIEVKESPEAEGQSLHPGSPAVCINQRSSTGGRHTLWGTREISRRYVSTTKMSEFLF
jgi:hypothetical protein